MENLIQINLYAERFAREESGSGFGYGSGYSYGCGSGSGYGSGFGSCSGDGSLRSLGAYCGSKVYDIDAVPTLIDAVLGPYAKGRILMDDMTTRPCYIAKEMGKFAHGDTLREALTALKEKLYDDMSLEDRISAFLSCHNLTDAYANRDLFSWHHRLTGSCLAGRKAWVESRGIDMDGSTTVEDFIRLCENDFGQDVIRALKKRIETHD